MSAAPTTQPIRVLLVDDDPMVCQGLDLMLSTTEDLVPVASVYDGDQVAAAVRTHRPHVVLMDVRMPRRDGITATAELVRDPDGPRVLVLTTWEHDEIVLRAVEAGAVGFLLKTSSPPEIQDSIRQVAAGNGALSPASAGQLISHARQASDGAARQSRTRADVGLTERETAVVRLLVDGCSNREIADRLYLGEATVKSHLTAAQQKTDTPHRTALAVYAVRQGLMD